MKTLESLYEAKGKKLTKDMVELKSAGSAFDTKTGMLYAMNVDGTYDPSNEVDILDVDPWDLDVDLIDKKVTDKFLKKNR
jgi:hypothetical protein